MPIFWQFFTGFTLLLSVINIGYYLYFSRFAFSKPQPVTSPDLPPVSILVCARNESSNLLENIPHILSQEYPVFEIVLINHCSEDSTGEVIDKFSVENTNVRSIHIKTENSAQSGKKHALSEGIELASHSHLLFIDADCKPASPYWVKSMVSGFQKETSLVLGYGAYEKIPNSFLNKLIQYETAITALQYFGYAKQNNTYMGVGRNLGYTKGLFEKTGGFQSHIHINAGDDDLFVNAAARDHSASCVYHPNAFTISSPKTSWKSWFQQKMRHTSVAHHYRIKHQLQLGLFYVSQFGFYTFLCLNLVSGSFSFLSLIILLRMGLVGAILYKGFSKLNAKELVLYFPFIELCLLLVQLSLFAMSRTTSSIPWTRNQT